MTGEILDAEVVETTPSGLAVARFSRTRSVTQIQAATTVLPDNPDDWVSPETEAQFWRGIPENTQKAYTYQWVRFIQWCCDENNGPPHPREFLPATVATVREYIRAHWEMRGRDGRLRGYRGQPYSPATIELALAVISVAHQRKGLLSPTWHPDVHTQFRAYKRDWKAAGFMPNIAASLSLDEVLLLCATQDLNSAAGLRNCCMFRLAFDIGSRNSELHILDRPHIKFGTFEGVDEMVVHIPWSKTDQDAVGNDCIIPADLHDAPEYCTVMLMRRQLRLLADHGFTRGPVFRQVATGAPAAGGQLYGRILEARTTRQSFEKVVARAARDAGLDHDPETGEERQIVPHSFRAGFATSGFEAGLDESDVAEGGRWSKQSRQVWHYKRLPDKRKNNVPRAIHDARMKQRQQRHLTPEE